MKNDKTAEILIAIALLGAAWYFYTRSQGLTLTGQYANPMLPVMPAGTGNHMSPVAPSNATGTAALNVFSAISKGIATLAQSLTHKSATGGNGPGAVPPNYAGIDPTLIGNNTGNPGVPYVSEAPPSFDPTLDNETPFWQWDFGFDRAPDVPNLSALAWTVTPDMAYIPPPPGA